MHRFIAAIALALALTPGVAVASDVTLDASPNPARVGDRVIHKVRTPVAGPLNVWVSARGFKQPGNGTLPPGAWSWECCPTQTAGTPAWHFRSVSPVAPGAVRFGAVARMPGSYLSTATVWNIGDSVWIRIG
jgi:hypothetical protein